MSIKWILVINILVVAIVSSCNSQLDVTEEDKPTEEEVFKQIEKTGLALRLAFARGDLEAIKMYHHPDVQKALGYNNLQVGRAEVLYGLQKTMESFELNFLDEKTSETFLYRGDVVIKQARFALELIPKNGDDSFVYRGRTLLVLQRFDESPTGWATIHEIIQPYEEPLN